ncbi:MAG: 16S rRNA (guanine(527)-N(7))-methyltransferase RsmG [Desulfobacteraceae bacterium]|nr:16S rRNA (guanine(527)-N(7))-methyltransferase RsmG [Desulfobacteraceae bacterium]MBC2756898.1 16S rRNA (guanine(527)-N(7))-methyltransferase RsmG [Desulfobacteraceae bacterium]
MNINSDEWKESLASLCRDFHIDIDRRQSDQMALYATELLAGNEKINLTAITDPAEVAEKHIIDSLIPGKYIQSVSSVPEITLLDIGTGGGFPGIPLKIFIPSLSVSLVDSSRKKINFLKYVIRILNLKNISAQQYRVEELSKHPDFAGQFDMVISRAFTSLKRFLFLAVPLIKPDGFIIVMKGKDVQKELDELNVAKIGANGYQINDQKIKLQVEKYRLPISGDDRSLVIAGNYFS